MNRLVRCLYAHRPWVLVAALVLVALMGWSASTLRMGQDVTELLPSLDEDDRLALDVLGRSTLFDRLYVELAGDDPGLLVESATALAERLRRDPRIEAVESMVTPREEARTSRVVFEHRFYLLDPQTPGLDDALDPALVPGKLDLVRLRLLSPVPGLWPFFSRDPLGLTDLVERRLQGSLAPSRLRMHDGFAFTPDLGRLLLVLRTGVRALRVDDAGDLVDDVRQMAVSTVDPGIEVGIAGAHVLSSESARAVKSDVTLAFVAASLGIMLLFALYFRRPLPVILGLVPSALGVLGGFAVSALVLGRTSAIAVGFGSIVVGISVDYSIHYMRERMACTATGGDPASAPAGALRAVMPSLLTGFGTTVVVFFFYMLSDFPLIRELGLFAGSGIATGFLASILLLPLAPWRPTPMRRTLEIPARLLHPDRGVAMLVIACVLGPVSVMIPFAWHLELEDDIRKLDYRHPETAAFEREFEARWLGPQQGRVAIALGEDLEQALQRSDQVASILSGARLAFTSPSQVLPSTRTQRTNLEFLFARDLLSLRETIEAGADARGFAEGSFEPFFEDLRMAREGDPPPLGSEDLAGTPMANLIAGGVVQLGARTAVLTFLPGDEPPSPVLASLAALAPNVMLTSRVHIMNEVFGAVRDEVLRLTALGILGILLTLLLRYRRLLPAVLSLIPVLVACVVTAGTFSIFGIEVNAIAVLAFTLIVGVGLDYGIFMVDSLRRGPQGSHSAGAVLVSGLTTMVSFGVLAACRNPVLRSTGLVVLTGVLASLVTALLLVPAIMSFLSREETLP